MKFTSKPTPGHGEVPVADEGRLEDIVQYWTEREECAAKQSDGSKNKCYVVSISADRNPLVCNAQLSEITNLVTAQGDDVVGSEIYHLKHVHPKTLLGTGTARELAARAQACGANLLVLDAELTPSQVRNLEDAAGMPVGDREGIILNVFLRHAKTRQARIQVEIAQLEYLRPRIRGIGINMDQQSGMIGGRGGPGETASELLARKLDGRLAELNKALLKIKSGGETQRKQRENCERIVLIGYTNAGKTSLMNALTAATLTASSMPFETLDTTSRSLSRHGMDVLLSDTVGFIRRLPKRLLASFESTLAEITEASLLAIVMDVSDYEWQEHLKTTLTVLKNLGTEKIPRFYVFNKVDRVSSVPIESFKEVSGDCPWMAVSSHNADLVGQLKAVLLEAVRGKQKTETVFVPYTAQDVMSMVYGTCRTIETEATDTGLKLRIQGSPQSIARIHARLREIV